MYGSSSRAEAKSAGGSFPRWNYLSAMTKLTTAVSRLPTTTFFSQVWGVEKTGRGILRSVRTSK